jgi:hypothetical protein
MSNPNTDNAAAEKAKAMQELQDRFSKKSKLVATSADDLETFIDFVTNVPGVVNWTDKAPKDFTGMALVKSGDNGPMRLISVPSKEQILADTTVQARFVKWVINHIVNAAMDEDAREEMFLTVAGTFKQKFDLEAFKYVAKAMVKKLREQGLLGITNVSLRLSLQSAAYAESMFPRMKPAQWEGVLKVMRQLAETHGQDVSIFDHWEATRSAKSADVGELNLDFNTLEAEMDKALSEDDSDETPPAAAVVLPTATPAPATPAA